MKKESRVVRKGEIGFNKTELRVKEGRLTKIKAIKWSKAVNS
jgi:hypothetical protein